MIFKTNKKKNTASIAKNSNNNTIIQESNIYIGSSISDTVSLLGEAGQYEIIQQQYSNYMSAIRKTHPLYPVFSVSPSKELDKLVSTPEAKDAFDKFPKRIKGTFRIDFNKYPYMDKSETPWDYAYRTQTNIELETTAYQEYLGDIPDPFPTTTYQEGMKTIIGPPEFPPAVKAYVISGDISIPILLRRKPCMEYGKIIFGTVPNGCAFELNITPHNDGQRTDFNITNIYNCDLNACLKREQLYCAIQKTKNMSIMIGEKLLLEYTFTDKELTNGIFAGASMIERFIECLLIIERHTKCKFNQLKEVITEEDYTMAQILAASLEEKWYKETLNFDELRCAYDRIPDDINNFQNISVGTSNIDISLYGQRFIIENLIIVYLDAKVNNIDSVMKNKKRNKENILLTFRPTKDKESFFKYYKAENIQLQT